MSALITDVCVFPPGFFSMGIELAEEAVGRGSAAAVVIWSELDPKSIDGLHELSGTPLSAGQSPKWSS